MILAEAAAGGEHWITPWLPLLGVIVGGLIVGAFAVYNRKHAAIEGKLPTVGEIWAEQRKLRDEVDGLRVELRRKERGIDAIANAFESLRSVFTSFVSRVQNGGSTSLTPDEKAALNLPVLSDSDWATYPPSNARLPRPPQL